MTEREPVGSWSQIEANAGTFSPEDDSGLIAEEFSSYVYWYYLSITF